MDLKHKIMLITGASSGIGAATAVTAAKEGAQVILLARTEPKLEQVAKRIRTNGGDAHVYPLDVTDVAVVRAVVAEITAVHGTPDILFNNAGAGQWRFVDETSMEEAQDMMAAPYFAAFNMTRAFLPAMLQRNSGLVINMSSIAGFMSWPGATAYAAVRWAMRGFNESLRADLLGTQIRTMLVAFAKVESEFWTHNPGSEDRLPGAQAMIPPLTAEQAAAAIVRGIRFNRRTVMAPLMLRVVLGTNTLFPNTTRWFLNQTGYQRHQ
ncbi:MAG: SDR family oxidoreductase [Ardenticatenaceae bacterium]|nr:SDR family oxidoreductase [Ardenticatenaceae bacterium]MCB8991336.1 SDR family oxidoreductase [Ardenticatenaceae bacterium]